MISLVIVWWPSESSRVSGVLLGWPARLGGKKFIPFVLIWHRIWEYTLEGERPDRIYAGI